MKNFHLLSIFFMLLSSSLCARSFNEMLEIAIENSSCDAVQLILAQTTLTQEEKQIFVEEAQEIIDDINSNLRLTDEHNYMCGYKRMVGGTLAVAMGLSTFVVSEMDNFPVRAVSFSGIATFLGGCGLIAWGKKAMNDEEKKANSHQKLENALRIKKLLLQARTRN